MQAFREKQPQASRKMKHLPLSTDSRESAVNRAPYRQERVSHLVVDRLDVAHVERLTNDSWRTNPHRTPKDGESGLPPSTERSPRERRLHPEHKGVRLQRRAP